jgi:hypothetical protein
MRTPRRTFGLAALFFLVAAALAWYRFAPRQAPSGQAPLVTVNATALQTLRADFNREVKQTRLIILLSPT